MSTFLYRIICSTILGLIISCGVRKMHLAKKEKEEANMYYENFVC